jgi:hypothetical protein
MSSPIFVQAVQFQPYAAPSTPPAAVLAVDWEQLLLAGALTLGLATIVALVIRKPLFDIMRMVCGTEVAARFWTVFTTVLLVMVPLFLVLAAAGGGQSLADFVRRTVYLVSFGIIGAFLAMGAAVMLSAPSQALARRRTAEIEAGLSDPSAAE